MATNKDRLFFTFALGDGSVVMAAFPPNKIDPTIPLHQQFNNAFFVERMPVGEAIDLGASLVVAGRESMSMKANEIRHKRLEAKPTETELGSMAALFEGMNLDPTSEMEAIQEALKKFDPDGPDPDQSDE